MGHQLTSRKQCIVNFFGITVEHDYGHKLITCSINLYREKKPRSERIHEVATKVAKVCRVFWFSHGWWLHHSSRVSCKTFVLKVNLIDFTEIVSCHFELSLKCRKVSFTLQKLVNWFPLQITVWRRGLLKSLFRCYEIVWMICVY